MNTDELMITEVCPLPYKVNRKRLYESTEVNKVQGYLLKLVFFVCFSPLNSHPVPFYSYPWPLLGILLR